MSKYHHEIEKVFRVIELKWLMNRHISVQTDCVYTYVCIIYTICTYNLRFIHTYICTSCYYIAGVAKLHVNTNHIQESRESWITAIAFYRRNNKQWYSSKIISMYIVFRYGFLKVRIYNIYTYVCGCMYYTYIHTSTISSIQSKRTPLLNAIVHHNQIIIIIMYYI